MAAHQCPYCLQEFANAYCLGPHKRQCAHRFYLGLPSASDFSDADGSPDEDAARPDEEDNSVPNGGPVLAAVTTLWQLAQRARGSKHGTVSSIPLPPVGRNLFFSQFTADYVCLQKEWEEHTTAISRMFDASFWETLEIVRRQPGACPHVYLLYILYILRIRANDIHTYTL